LRRNPLDKELLQKLYHEQGLTQQAIANRLGVSPSHISREMKRLGIPIRTPSEYHNRYPKYDFDGTDMDKAYLIGFRTGDWYVRQAAGGTNFCISVCSNKPAQLQHFYACFADYGHIAVTQNVGPRHDETRLRAYLNASWDFLVPNPHAIPDWILADDDLFLSFWAGYTDADGTIGYRTFIYRGVPKVSKWAQWNTKKDKQLLQQGRQRLHEMGFRPSNIMSAKRQPDTRHFGIYNYTGLYKFLTAILPLLRHADRRAQAIKTLEFVKEHYIPPDASGQYPCPYCDFVGTSPGSLQVHLSRWCQYKPTPTSEQ